MAVLATQARGARASPEDTGEDLLSQEAGELGGAFTPREPIGGNWGCSLAEPLPGGVRIFPPPAGDREGAPFPAGMQGSGFLLASVPTGFPPPCWLRPPLPAPHLLVPPPGTRTSPASLRGCVTFHLRLRTSEPYPFSPEKWADGGHRDAGVPCENVYGGPHDHPLDLRALGAEGWPGLPSPARHELPQSLPLPRYR